MVTAVVAFGLAAVVTASAPAASPVDPLYGSFSPPTAADLAAFPPKDGLGTNTGLSPRLSAIANGLSTESKAAQASDLSLRANGPGSLQRDGNRIIVTARADSVTHALLGDLRAAGAEVVANNSDFGTVDLSVLPDDLVAVARVAGVESVSEALEPIVGRVDGVPRPTALVSRSGGQTKAINTCQGSRTAEGDVQMQAATARQTFGVDGTGQKVGILSDSFDVGQNSTTRADQDVATGDLPGLGNPCGHTTPTQVIAEGTATNEDEGRGMAQIVHDMAPGAELAFAASGASADDMANNVLALKNAGSSVIVDDITYFDEPFFQQGSVSTAVDQVVAAGVPYYSSAANSNVIVNGHNVGSYEAPAFRSAGDCLGLGGACMDFNAGAPTDNSFGLALNGGSQLQINLQWAEPRNGVTTDLDVVAVDNTLGNAIVAQATTNNLQTQKPFELMNVQNSDSAPHIYFIVVYRDAATASGTPRLKFNLGRPQLAAAEYETPTGSDIIGPTIFGHNGAPNAVSTAAIPYDNAAAPETFSSRGPLAYYFGPVSGTTPAAALSAPQVLNKPDLAATDNVQTTFFIDNSSGVYRFAGTSAAAPAAAAVAALQKSANPFLSTADVVGAQTASAVPVGSFSHADVGAGLVNAVGAISLHPPLVPETMITKEPKKKIYGKRAKYKFTSTLPGSEFICQLDRSKPQKCSSPVRAVHLSYGKHRFRVAAVFNNQVDPTPAKDQFKRKHRGGRHL